MRAQFAALGVSVREAEDEASDDAVDVWAENWDSVLLFLDLSTQWNAVIGMAGFVWLGLDYAAADAVLRRRRWKREKADAAFADLKTLEGEALKALAEMER